MDCGPRPLCLSDVCIKSTQKYVVEDVWYSIASCLVYRHRRLKAILHDAASFIGVVYISLQAISFCQSSVMHNA